MTAASKGLNSPARDDDDDDSATGKSAAPAKVGLWGRIRGKGKAAEEMPVSVKKVLEDDSCEDAALNAVRRNRREGGQQQDNDYSDNESAGGQVPERSPISRGANGDANVDHSAAIEAAVARVKAEAREELEAVRNAAATAAAEAASENSELAGLNEQLKRRVADLEAELKELREVVATTKQECAESLKELTEKVREGETKRRKMHNLIQELRGNVRVFARVRPFLPGDKAKGPDPKPWLEVKDDEWGLKEDTSIAY